MTLYNNLLEFRSLTWIPGKIFTNLILFNQSSPVDSHFCVTVYVTDFLNNNNDNYAWEFLITLL